MLFDVAKKEFGVVNTLSFFFNKTNDAKCNAAVPFATATAYFASVNEQILSSNSLTFGPVVKYSDFKVSITAVISLASIFCFP